MVLAQRDSHSLEIFGAALRHGDIRVLEAASGEEAIRLAVTLRPDLALVGFQLGMVDGWRVLEVLRSEPPGDELPVVALTADARVSTRKEALRAGFDEVWTKPIDAFDLLSRVRRILER